MLLVVRSVWNCFLVVMMWCVCRLNLSSVMLVILVLLVFVLSIVMFVVILLRIVMWWVW